VFFLLGGVADGELDQEAVNLGLRQGKGALQFDGVLGSHHQEGARQGVGHAVHRDLPLLHGL